MHVTHKIPDNKRVTHKSIQDSKGYAKIAPNVSQSSVLGTPKIALRDKMWANMSPNELQCDPKWHRWHPQKATCWCQMATSLPSGSQIATKLKNLKNQDFAGSPFLDESIIITTLFQCRRGGWGQACFSNSQQHRGAPSIRGVISVIVGLWPTRSMVLYRNANAVNIYRNPRDHTLS